MRTIEENSNLLVFLPFCLLMHIQGILYSGFSHNLIVTYSSLRLYLICFGNKVAMMIAYWRDFPQGRREQLGDYRSELFWEEIQSAINESIAGFPASMQGISFFHSFSCQSLRGSAQFLCLAEKFAFLAPSFHAFRTAAIRSAELMRYAQKYSLTLSRPLETSSEEWVSEWVSDTKSTRRTFSNLFTSIVPCGLENQAPRV